MLDEIKRGRWIINKSSNGMNIDINICINREIASVIND